MTSLTDTQAVFAAENHNLIYEFLNQRNLSESEYYDTVIFAFLECVAEDNSEDFKDRAFKAMDLAAKEMKASEFPETVSLYDYADSCRTFSEILFSESDEIGELLERIDCEAILLRFNQTEREILELLLQGFCFTEIAFRLKQTVNELSVTVNQIKAKAGSAMLPAAA